MNTHPCSPPRNIKSVSGRSKNGVEFKRTISMKMYFRVCLFLQALLLSSCSDEIVPLPSLVAVKFIGNEDFVSMEKIEGAGQKGMEWLNYRRMATGLNNSVYLYPMCRIRDIILNLPFKIFPSRTDWIFGLLSCWAAIFTSPNWIPPESAVILKFISKITIMAMTVAVSLALLG